MAQRQKTEFGQYLVDQIKAAGMSQESFYKKVGITKPYFYDLLKSAPPAEMQRKMADVLDAHTGIDTTRRRMLFDLAAQERGDIPADIAALILNHLDAADQVRNALAEIVNCGTEEV
jgi:hypothetical protein